MGLMGPSADQSLSDWVLEVNTPSPFGGLPSVPQQTDFRTGSLGQNYLKNGSFESWSGWTTVAPDGWTVSKNASAVIQKVASADNLRYGEAAVEMDAVSPDNTSLTQAVRTISTTQNQHLRGKTVTFSCWAKVGTANRVRLEINDGVTTHINGTFHTGSGEWELLRLTTVLAALATKLDAIIQITGGATIGVQRFDGAVLVEGSGIVAFTQHPNDEQLRLSNFQSTTPTNNTDQGVWRAETGLISIAPTTDTFFKIKTVTFQTAFRVIRVALVTATIGGVNVGGKQVIWNAQSLAAGTFDIRITSTDATNFTTTDAGTAAWAVIGQV